jgi:pilus assembly protein Flp/PilA
MSSAVTLRRSTQVRMISIASRGLTDDPRGVTALEYALIAAVMGVLVVTAVTTLGNSLDTAFTSIGALMTATAAGM